MCHFMIVCKECDKIIKQCKCMDKNKEVKYDTCEECKDQNAHADHETRID